MEMIQLLEKLTQAFGPPGFEDDVREIIRQEASPLADRVEEDLAGNLTVWRNGTTDRIVMLDAHTDEVGILLRT